MKGMKSMKDNNDKMIKKNDIDNNNNKTTNKKLKIKNKK